MNLRLSCLPLAALVSLMAPASAVDLLKADNTSNLNTAASWVDGIVPGPGDIAVYDGTIPTVPLNSPMGGDLNWDGIRVSNVGGTRNVAGTVTAPRAVIVNSPSSANTLTLGPSGIDMGSALQGLAIWSKVTLAGDQTWNIANSNNVANPGGLNQNEDLSLVAQAAAVPFNLGGFTVTKSGSGTTAYSSGWTISNGIFQVNTGVLHIQGGSSRVTTVENTVTFNVNSGATLRFAAQSGAGGLTTQIDAPVNLTAGSNFALLLNQAPAMNLTGPLDVQGNSTLTVTGGAATPTTFSGALLGNANLTYANNATNASAFVNMTGNNSGYSGNLIVNGASGTRVLRLGSATAGSAAATWTVAAANTLQAHGVTVTLGTLNGAGTLTNSGTGPAVFSIAAGEFSGTVTNGAAPAATTGLTKTGPGVLRFTGAPTSTGPIDVQGGSLATNITHGGAGDITTATGTAFVVETRPLPGTFSAASLTTAGGPGTTVAVETGGFGNPVLPAVTLLGAFNPGAGTVMELRGTATTSGTFPILKYTGAMGGAGFAGLTLKLPFRVLGTLIDNSANSTIDVNITGVEAPRWNGNLSPNWDLDDGTGTGTLNWRTITTGTATRYLQSPANTDQVRFDDTAAGTGTVNLTTVLTPVGIRVENAAKAYTFIGSGNLSGTGGLVKAGTGDLFIANTAVNDHTGPNSILGGRLFIGDNTTFGAGSLGTGPTGVTTSLILNRPDDFDFPNPLTGNGILIQQGAGMAHLAAPLGITGGVTITSGGLRLSGGGALANAFTVNGQLLLDSALTLSGPLSGTGEINAAGTAAKSITGTVSNPFTGLLKVTGGTLALNMTSGQDAVQGNVLVEGGTLTFTLADQLSPTANVTVLGGAINTVNRADTIQNLTISSPSPVSTFSGLTITDTLRVTAGIHDAINSAGTLTTQTAILSGNSITRYGTNSGNSIWNIGSGGLSMDNANIQYGNAGAAFTAQTNLNGNFTGTGINNISRPNSLGPRLLDLQGANRTFNITEGLTTIAVDIVNGGLLKTGPGQLLLTAATNAYAGPTVIQEGAFALGLDGDIPASSSIELTGGTFDVSAKFPGFVLGAGRSLLGSGTIVGNVEVRGTFSPGTATVPGTLSVGNLTFGAGSTFAVRIKGTGTPAANLAALTGDLVINPAALLTATALDATSLPSGTVVPIITYTGTWDGGTFAGLPAGGTLTAGSNTWAIKYNDTIGGVPAVTLTSGAASAYDSWASAAGLTGADALRTADPDGDGSTNQLEFAVGTSPAPGAGNVSTPAQFLFTAVQDISGTPRLTLTLPVRNGASFTGTPEKTADIDGVRYRIQGSGALGDWALPVTEVTPALAAGLPALPTGWTWRTFHTPGPVSSTSREFIRLKAE